MGGALESQMLALAEHLLLAWLTSPYVFPILPTWISTFTKIDPRILWSGEIAYLRHFQAHRLTEVCVSGCQTPCNSLVHQFDAIAHPNPTGPLIRHVFILHKLRVLADLLSKRVPVWIFGILRGVNWQSYPKTIWNHWLSLVQRCPARISSWCRPLSKRNKFFRFQPPFGPYAEAKKIEVLTAWNNINFKSWMEIKLALYSQYIPFELQRKWGGVLSNFRDHKTLKIPKNSSR